MSLVYTYGMYRKEINALALADFGRTRALADRLQRDEARLMARLLIAQAVLADKPESEASTGAVLVGSSR